MALPPGSDNVTSQTPGITLRNTKANTRLAGQIMLKVVLLGLTIIAILGIAFFGIFYLPLPDKTARLAVGEEKWVTRDDRIIAYYVQGSGPLVILLASLGREASDFNELATDLMGNGYRTVAIEPPGIGRSTLPSEDLTLWDLADDVDAVALEERAGTVTQKVFILGHAFGNRVARTFAARHTEDVAATLLIAAGGKQSIEQKAATALRNCFNPLRSSKQRLADIRYGFFSGDNVIPPHWQVGWHRHTATMQGKATASTPSEEWWDAGGTPLLVVQADADRIAPKQDTADLLAQEFGDRVTVALINNAGHALLPEQPQAVSEAILNYLQSLN